MMHKFLYVLVAIFTAITPVKSQEIDVPTISKYITPKVPDNAPTNASVVVWRGEPLKINIPVRKDRVIKFQGSSRIQVGVPREMQGIASAESIRGIVYLRSFKAFENVRFWFRDKDTQEIFVAEVSAKETGVYSPLVVVKPGVEIVENQNNESVLGDSYSDSVDHDESTSSVPPIVVDDPVVEREEPIKAPVAHGKTILARYAFQTLYAPDRLVEELENVSEITVERGKRLRRMFVGNEISAQPLAQWKNEGTYVTAFLLRNKSDRHVDIDPRKIRGSEYWDATSFMTDRLSARNTYGDSTAMVVISDKRFEEYERWLH